MSASLMLGYCPFAPSACAGNHWHFFPLVQGVGNNNMQSGGVAVTPDPNRAGGVVVTVFALLDQVGYIATCHGDCYKPEAWRVGSSFRGEAFVNSPWNSPVLSLTNGLMSAAYLAPAGTSSPVVNFVWDGRSLPED